ncbi:MAG: DUF6503 family protein [Thermoanaerobaculia bacterium]
MLRVGSRFAFLIALLSGALSAEPPAGASSREAEALIDAMVEAHGGRELWAAAPTVSFEDEFKRGEADSGLVSRVTVEQGRRRAYIDFPGSEMRLAWNGEKAWSESWTLAYPPRFLALLNYYFLNLPWMAKDPGIILGEPGTARLWDDPTEYVTVKLTYEEGVGDTPDDYFLLYLHPETHRLKACEYVVTYRALLPDGVEAADPHVLVFDEYSTVDGLTVPTHYTIYESDRTLYGSCDIRNWSLRKPFDESRMIMPQGAVLDESTP